MTETAETTEAAAPAVITIDGPNDWLAAAKDHRVRFPHSGFGQHQRTQHGIALGYLLDRVQAGTVTGTTPATAAVILIAGIDAPRAERNSGVRTRAHDESCAAAMAELEHEGCECWCHVPVIEPTAVIEPPGKGKPRKPKAETAAAATDKAEAEAEAKA